MLKRTFLFTGIFTVLLIGLQIVSGLLLTYFYIPDIKDAWNSVELASSQIAFGDSGTPSLLNFFVILVAAIFAFVMSQTLSKKGKQDLISCLPFLYIS